MNVDAKENRLFSTSNSHEKMVGYVMLFRMIVLGTVEQTRLDPLIRQIASFILFYSKYPERYLQHPTYNKKYII